MYQLADINSECALHHYLSPIASQAIIEAIDRWIITPTDVVELYQTYLTMFAKERDYFEGLGQYLGSEIVSEDVKQCIKKEQALYGMEVSGDVLKHKIAGKEIPAVGEADGFLPFN